MILKNINAFDDKIVNKILSGRPYLNSTAMA